MFTFGTASQPLGLDPALVSDIESYRITRQVLEGLVGVDQTTGEPTPLLATEWTPSDDGLAYTFKLREKVTFQDGTAFDAAAVCSNFNRWFNFPDTLRQAGTGDDVQGRLQGPRRSGVALHLQGLHRRGPGQCAGSN